MESTRPRGADVGRVEGPGILRASTASLRRDRVVVGRLNCIIVSKLAEKGSWSSLSYASTKVEAVERVDNLLSMINRDTNVQAKTLKRRS